MANSVIQGMSAFSEGFQQLGQGAKGMRQQKEFSEAKKAILEEDPEQFEGGAAGQKQAGSLARVGDIGGAQALRKKTPQSFEGMYLSLINQMQKDPANKAKYMTAMSELDRVASKVANFGRDVQRESPEVQQFDVQKDVYTNSQLYEGVPKKPKEGIMENEAKYQQRLNLWEKNAWYKMQNNINKGTLANYPYSSRQSVIDEGFARLLQPGFNIENYIEKQKESNGDFIPVPVVKKKVAAGTTYGPEWTAEKRNYQESLKLAPESARPIQPPDIPEDVAPGATWKYREWPENGVLVQGYYIMLKNGKMELRKMSEEKEKEKMPVSSMILKGW